MVTNWNARRPTLEELAGFQQHLSDEFLDKVINAAQPHALPSNPYLWPEAGEAGKEMLRREALEIALNAIINNYKLSEFTRSLPTEAQIRNRFAKIQRKTADLVRLLSDGRQDNSINTVIEYYLTNTAGEFAKRLGGYPQLPPTVMKGLLVDGLVDYHGKEAVGELYYWLQALSAWSHSLSEYTLKTHKNSREDDFFHGTAYIWNNIFEKEIATSTNWETGEAEGPFIRFIAACIEPVGIRMTSEGIRDRVRRMFQGKGR